MSKEELVKEVERKNKLLEEARKKYVETVEKARKEYVETKQKLFPELIAPTPAEAGRTIQELQEKIKELEKKLAEAGVK
jgi:vacuolar-type H+-ATPase subunit H